MSLVFGQICRLLLYIIHILPRSVQKKMGQLIGLVWFDILRIRRDQSISGVRQVFPEKTLKQATSMARASLIHLGYTIVEVCSMPFLSKTDIQKLVSIEGQEHLDAALAKGKGVLLISVHIGNGDLGTAALAHAGYPVHLVSKLFKTQWINDFWFNARKKHGTQFIAPKKSSYEILKALKKNEIVIFVLDQYTGPPNGIVTEFFGKKTGTAFGPALFAQRTGTAVIPAYSDRQAFGKHTVNVLPPIEYKTKGPDKEELLRENTQRFSDSVEEMILRKPNQWMWVHRRWKQIW